METVRDFIFEGSKITADGDCSHEVKRGLLLGRKAMTNLDSILEKEMATHSSIFAWRIPGAEEPGWLPSMGSHRVGHNWNNLLAAAAELVKDMKMLIEKKFMRIQLTLSCFLLTPFAN